MHEHWDGRAIATAVIWLGAGFAIAFTNINSGDLNVYNMVISLGIAFGAAIASLSMWQGSETSKAKRDHQLLDADASTNLLLQLMTDEERRAVRSRLINSAANDGEIIAARDDESHYVSSQK